MNEMIGKLLRGRYYIIRQLGGGVFGQTYLAEDRQQLDAAVCVVKQLKSRLNEPLTLREVKRRFSTEATFLERLGSHDRIPKLLDRFEENQEFYLVQEFIEGEDLSKEIKEGKCLTEAQVIALLKDVLEILEFIHQQGVIHCGIKPSNLIRRRHDGKIVLINFGAGKEIGTSVVKLQRQRITTLPLAIDGYMAPEQWDTRPRFSSDIYALGMTAIQALTGKSPNWFQKDTQTGEVLWRQTGIPVSQSLAKILDKTVCYDFRERYQSASEVLKALRKSESIKLALPRFIKLKPILAIPLIAGVILSILLPRLSIDKANGLYNEGNKLLNSEQYEKAITVYNQVIGLKPDFYEALSNRGYALGKLHRYKDSLESCEKALQIKSDDVLALNCKGVALQRLQQYDKALAAYDQALQLDQFFVDGWNNRGETLMQLNRDEEAIVAFDKAINIKYNYYFAWNNKGRALYRLGRYQEAIDVFNKAIELKPDYYYAWIGLGNALTQLQQIQPALAAYDQATRIEPNAYEAWYSRGLALEKLQYYKEALYSYNRAIQINPNYQAAIKAKQRLSSS